MLVIAARLPGLVWRLSRLAQLMARKKPKQNNAGKAKKVRAVKRKNESGGLVGARKKKKSVSQPGKIPAETSPAEKSLNPKPPTKDAGRATAVGAAKKNNGSGDLLVGAVGAKKKKKLRRSREKIRLKQVVRLKKVYIQRHRAQPPAQGDRVAKLPKCKLEASRIVCIAKKSAVTDTNVRLANARSTTRACSPLKWAQPKYALVVSRKVMQL